jgi:hypothetical protein
VTTLNKKSFDVDLTGILLILETAINLPLWRGLFKTAGDPRARSGGFDSHAVLPITCIISKVFAILFD